MRVFGVVVPFRAFSLSTQHSPADCVEVPAEAIRANKIRTCGVESSDSNGHSWRDRRVRSVGVNCYAMPSPYTTMWNWLPNRFESSSSSINRSLWKWKKKNRINRREFNLTKLICITTVTNIRHSQRTLCNIRWKNNFSHIWIDITIDRMLLIQAYQRVQQQNFPFDSVRSTANRKLSWFWVR